MANLIDKSALVAEIKKWISGWTERLNNTNPSNPSFFEGGIAVGKHILSFIDTLEVKEVDLEKEIKKIQRDYKTIDEYEGYFATIYASDIELIAKHFFELGLRSTITEEDCKLIWNISDEIPCMVEEDFFKELLKRYKAQKGEEV